MAANTTAEMVSPKLVAMKVHKALMASSRETDRLTRRTIVDKMSFSVQITANITAITKKECLQVETDSDPKPRYISVQYEKIVF